jgi:signal transduction histidine kinase
MAQLSESETLFIILVGSSGMLLLILAIGVFLFVYQKRIFSTRMESIKRDQEHAQNMIKAQLEIQERERNRIGADLHDSLGSLLWGAKVNASFIERTVALTEKARESYCELIQILDQSINSVRRISWELTPEAFHHAGFSQSVAKLCDQLNGRGLEVKVTDNGKYIWNDENGIQAFRIVQELVSNAVKHSKADLIIVIIDWQKSLLLIEVRDNGIGFKLNDSRTGVGWWNIGQRAKRLNAEIAVGNTPNEKGSVIIVKIPLKNDTE